MRIIVFRLSDLRQRRRGIVRRRGREETVGDVVHPDGEGGMSAIDGFGANCFRKKASSCCNLGISARTVAKSA